MSGCEWNPLHKRPNLGNDEPGSCKNPVAWGVGFSKAQWFLCNKCVKLPIFKRFKFKEKREPKLQCIEDDFEL
jgi:hypothetical protein